MDILTEGTRKAEFLVSEANDWRSRDAVIVTVPANTTLASGTILGKITATGKFTRQDTAAVDGSQSHAALLFEPLVNNTAAAVDYDVTAVARDAEVNGADLTYEASATAGEITAANAALAALGIIVR
jgi:hypothetical protein